MGLVCLVLRTSSARLSKVKAAITEHHIAADKLKLAERASERLTKCGENHKNGTMVTAK